MHMAEKGRSWFVDLLHFYLIPLALQNHELRFSVSHVDCNPNAGLAVALNHAALNSSPGLYKLLSQPDFIFAKTESHLDQFQKKRDFLKNIRKLLWIHRTRLDIQTRANIQIFLIIALGIHPLKAQISQVLLLH